MTRAELLPSLLEPVGPLLLFVLFLAVSLKAYTEPQKREIIILFSQSLLTGYGVSLAGWGSGDENVLALVVTVAQTCEYAKKKSLIYFKRVSCMICELYLNKAVSKTFLLFEGFLYCVLYKTTSILRSIMIHLSHDGLY